MTTAEAFRERPFVSERPFALGRPRLISLPRHVSAPSPQPLWRQRRLLPWALAIGAYLVLGMVTNLPAWIHGVGHELTNQGGDLDQAVWFLGVTPYSILHGSNPFVTSYLNYPYSVNLMSNTAMFLPGVFLAPVTLIWGPVVSFNVLMVFCYTASATAAFAVFRRWAPWKPAAFVGGLLYGFSTYMVGAGYGHLNLLFAVFPPLFLLVLDNILIRQSGRPVAWGIALGLLAGAQFLTSTEILASTAVVTACGTLLLVIFRWRHVAAKLSYAGTALFCAVVVFGILCSYPLALLLLGPEHFNGPAQTLSPLAYSSDLLGLIVPTHNELLGPGALKTVGDLFVGDNSENSTYLGIGLLIVLVEIVIRYRRQAVVRFAAAMAGVAFLVSLGGQLQIGGYASPIDLPFLWLRSLPLLDSAIPIRYCLFMWLFVGLLLAVGLDRLFRDRELPGRSRPLGACLCAVVAAFALVPLIPQWPYAIAGTGVPAFFSTSVVRTVPQGSVLLPYPFPRATHAQAMLWQAVDGFRYEMPGGYVITADSRGTATYDGASSTTEGLLEDAYAGQALPPMSTNRLCDVDNDLSVWRVQTIVVTPQGTAPQEALELFDAALGTRPQMVAGSFVYYDVATPLRAQAAAMGCQPTVFLP